jgi:2-amino-4-hydroxy-6-hydroxymethyldihydropteridine diphosphokinase
VFSIPARGGLADSLLTLASDGSGVRTILALGANLGDPIVQLGRAVEALGRVVCLEAVSDVHRTEPVGLKDQPDFYNLVVSGRTNLTLFDLHAAAEAIERTVGRVRTVRNGPRLIDVDLLCYGELVYASSSLTVPHPRMEARSFVLVPLGEIAPEWRHPVTRATAAELMAALESPSAVERIGPLVGTTDGYSSSQP